jgi:Protein of unknown function (DUF3040)
MLTTREQQKLHQIEEDLRDTDHGFAWRLTLLQGVLRWAAPGRQAYLLALAALAAALLRLVAATGRLLMACAEILGDTAWPGWPGWESGQAPGPSTRPARDRPQSDGTDLR